VRYPAKYSAPLSELKYTAAALPPTTVKASATATNPAAINRFMIDLLLRYRVDGLHAAGVLLATRIFSTHVVGELDRAYGGGTDRTLRN